MALAVTTLNGAVTLNQQQIRLTAFTNPSSGGISAPTVAVIDGEAMLITDTSLAPVLGVSRGHSSPMPGLPTQSASAHNTLAPVVYGLTSDFTQTASTTGVAGIGRISYGVDATVTLPVVDATVYLDKASALALTINGPNKDQTNTITFVSLTAAAHTITYTAGFYGNTTSSDVVTFPSTIGAAFVIYAKNGVWNIAYGGGGTGGVTGPA